MDGILNLPDGRQLEYIDNGIASDHAIVLHHGSPIEMRFWTSTLDQLSGLGIRAIAFTRPGYGGSTRLPDRNLLDGNADLSNLLSHLDVNNFASIGWSAGGPPALASGLLDGCVSISAIASPAPFDAHDLDFYSGMGEEFAKECAATVISLESAFEYKQAATAPFASFSAHDLINALTPRAQMPQYFDLYEVMGQELLDSLLSALTPDAMGYVEDDRAWLKPWGFKTEDINVDVDIWLGKNDVFIPAPHAEWLSRHTKHSTLHLLDDQDHISIWVENKEQIMENAIRALA